MKTQTRNASAPADRRVAPRLHEGALIPAQHFAGTVVNEGAGRFGVRSAGQLLDARRAASCLLEPQPGDSVACLRLAPAEVWVIAVLQREEGAEHLLRTQGPARLQSASGALALEAQSLKLEAGELVMQADQLRAQAEAAELHAGQVSVIGQMVKLCGAALSTVFERATHFSRSHLRTTTGLDRVQAEQLEQQAKQLLHLSGEHVLVEGERLVKARGSQIHFG